jgi:hypothetical protein
MASPSPSILRIERINYAIGGIVIIIAALSQPRDIALGIAVGVALTCANFFVLRQLVVKWTKDAAEGKAGSAQILMMPKMIGLMAAVVLSLKFLPIDPVAFTIGYSIFIISIVVDTFYSAFRPSPSTPSTTNEQNHG